jgi:hypothetical protein
MMAHAYHHAVSSARRFGGKPEDYLAIHQWFDSTKDHCADARHRLILHNTFGIRLAEQVHGVTITNSAGTVVPVRTIGEQHVREDFGGQIPTLTDVIDMFPSEAWVSHSAGQLSKELERVSQTDAE